MGVNPERLKEIRKEIRYVSHIVDVPVIPIDTNRRSYLFTELDTLVSAISLVQDNAYKESLILIRTALEKFLFFWLMFDGRNYKWTEYVSITPQESMTPNEARDKTFDIWMAKKKSGDPQYQNVNIQRSKKKDDVIILTYEEKGMSVERNGKRTKEIVPIHNIMLQDYNPDINHLSDLDNISHTTLNLDNAEELILLHKTIYNHYFYIKSIFSGLLRNKLVSKFQLDIIRIHYNFLSRYVHPSIHGIELWSEIDNSSSEASSFLRELILLYICKLMQLYIKIFISGYKKTRSRSTLEKFKSIVKELGEMSKDFWFYDNKPISFDLKYSKGLKESWKRRRKKVPKGLVYNENPLSRLIMLRNSGDTNN